MTKRYSSFDASTWESMLFKSGELSSVSVFDLAEALNIATMNNNTTVANTLAKPKPFVERFIYVSYYFLMLIFFYISHLFTLPKQQYLQKVIK